MAFGLFEKPRRRRSSGGGGGKALDTVILIAGLGVIGFVGYGFIRGGKGFEEAQDTAGRAAKGFVDAISDAFDWGADRSYDVQKALGIGNTPTGRDEEDTIIESISKGVKSDVKKRAEKYTKGPLASYLDWFGRNSPKDKNQPDYGKSAFDTILSVGCGVIRKC